MTNREDLVEALSATRKQLLRAADAVPAEARKTPFVGHWHLMDLLAHLIGWDYTNLEALQALSRGETPEFYGHYDPGWAGYNQLLVERYGSEQWDALRDEIERSLADIKAVLKSLTPGQISMEHKVPDRQRPLTIAAILRAAIRDEQEHLKQIKAFVAALQS